jgi:hypothetical protein
MAFFIVNAVKTSNLTWIKLAGAEFGVASCLSDEDYSRSFKADELPDKLRDCELHVIVKHL